MITYCMYFLSSNMKQEGTMFPQGIVTHEEFVVIQKFIA